MNSPKTLLFAIRIVFTHVSGAPQLKLRNIVPCWVQGDLAELSGYLQAQLENNYEEWLRDVRVMRFGGASVNCQVVDIGGKIDVLVRPVRNGRLYFPNGDPTACARAGWCIRDRMRALELPIDLYCEVAPHPDLSKIEESGWS